MTRSKTATFVVSTKKKKATYEDMNLDEVEDFFVECTIHDRIITLKELSELQSKLSKIKGFYFEIHAAITAGNDTT